MTISEQKNQTEISKAVEDVSNGASISMLLMLKIVEYLFLAASVCAIVITKTFPDIQVARIYVAAFFSIWLFLFLVNKQLVNNSNQSDITKKAELYNSLSANNNSSKNNPLTPAREKALQYSQDLIDDYKKIRGSSRNIYYTLQLATVIFSGVTPILVLVDKLNVGISWFR